MKLCAVEIKVRPSYNNKGQIKVLASEDFVCKGREWTKRGEFSKKEIKRLKRKLKRPGTDISITDINLTRSEGYRKEFLQKTHYAKVYRCAYCGKKIARQDMTVDHILPVASFRNNKNKWLLKMLKIKNINDIKNLAPACYGCNFKKGTKTGIWTIIGFLGKDNKRRVMMNILKVLFYVLMGAVIIKAALYFI